MSVMILWTKLLMEEQGHEIEKSTLHQDNKSAALLEESGKKSSNKRTGALSVCCFFLLDQVKKGNVIIEHCLTEDVIGDFHTKPLQGEKFCKHRDAILGR